MEFDILYAIGKLHSAFLNSFFLILTNVVGNYGHLWLIIGAILLFFRKTRKCGFTILLSYAFVYGIGNMLLKDLIARPRPCHIDQTVALLVPRPSSYSCPSTHTAWAFAAAASILMYYRKWGVAVFAAAVVVGFSRMYLFVHFPTDVLFGAALGMVFGAAAAWIVGCISRGVARKKNRLA